MVKTSLAIALVLVGCGDDSSQGAADAGSGSDADAVITRGVVTVYTYPGVRVDFMSAATDQVVSSGVADASGKAEAEIDYGDRAVIVSGTTIRVLDQLEPAKIYRAADYIDGQYMLDPNVSVTVSWPAPAGGDAYRLSSLCAGTSGYISTETSTRPLCNAGDGILVTAYDSSFTLIGSAYQIVASPAAGPLAFTAPFLPHRDVAMTLALPPGALPGDLSATLITAEGAKFQDEPDFAGTTTTVTVPPFDGDLQTFAQVTVPGVGARWMSDRRPIADAIALDMNELEFPYVTSFATKDANGPTVSWTQSGQGTPTLVMIAWGTGEASYTLITRYTGTAAVLPVLPPDVTPMPMPSQAAALVAASPDGYEAAIESLARRRDPKYGHFTVYYSTFF